MAVEFAVDLATSIGLAPLLATMRAVEAELLGLDEVPPLSVVLARRRDQGLVAVAGRTATPVELERVVVGPDAPDVAWEVVDADGSTVVLPLLTRFGDTARLTLEPRRDACGIVTALAAALAAALLGEAEVLDHDLVLSTPSIQPATFVAETRLPPADRALPAACVTYLRQFPSTRDWPPH